MRKGCNVSVRSLHFSAVASLLVITIVLFLFVASPVLAAVAQPDTIAIAEVRAYRHCLEEDDLLVIAKYHLDYTTNPDDSVEYTYLCRMMQGTTELASTTPYWIVNKGYDWGIFSFYFSASEAPAWEGSYAIRLEGNPTLEWDGGTPPLVSTTSILWINLSDMNDTETYLGNWVLYLAQDFANRWSTTLTTEVTGGTVLNSTGQQYFANSIRNLREITPDIFSSGVEGVVFTEEDHTQSYQTSLLGRIGTGDMLGRARASVANLLNTSNDVAGAILFFMFLGAIIWGIAYATGGQTRPIAFILIPMVIMGNLIGLLSLAFTLVIGLLCAIASAYILFYKGASV